jgi:ferredoxin like protein
MSTILSSKLINLDTLLGLDKYAIDEEQSHIQVAADRCAHCEGKPCLTVCPARVYQWVDERIAVHYENCLECGTCLIACHSGGNGAITWRNPQGGFGVLFRYG